MPFVPLATACVFAAATAAAQDPAAPAPPPPAAAEQEERTTGLPGGVDWTFNFDASWGSFGFANSLYSNPKPEQPSGNLSDQWFEGAVKPALTATYTSSRSWQLYAKASVLVLPARAATHFGIPNVIVEAQAASLPVVCTRLPALSELIEDDVSGVYVPEDDAPRLAQALRALFDDPARRRRLAAEGLRRVTARFDISETAQAWVRLLTGAEAASARRAAAG